MDDARRNPRIAFTELTPPAARASLNTHTNTPKEHGKNNGPLGLLNSNEGTQLPPPPSDNQACPTLPTMKRIDKAMPQLNESMKAHGEKGYELVGVSTTGAGAVLCYRRPTQ